MSRNDLLERVRQRPFAPFRLVLTEGTPYDIRHPEQVMVARHSAVIGLEGKADQDFYETTVLVDLLHVVRSEPLEAGKTSGNGQGQE